MKQKLLLAAVSSMLLSTHTTMAQTDADNFYKSNAVTMEKVVFHNQLGAVKEQCANLYATKMAERGSGSFAISAAKIDPRLKAIATVSMYDMGTASRSGLGNALSLEQRKAIIAEAAEQRYIEFEGGATRYTGGTVHELTAQSNPIEREFFEFYRTPRGEVTPEGATPLTTTRPTLTSNVKFMNFYPFADIETISPRPLLFIAGEHAHSREFSESAYRLAAEPKELCIVPNAGHVDLYDRTSLIPFDKIETFFKTYLK